MPFPSPTEPAAPSASVAAASAGTRCVLALGGNLGKVPETFNACLAALQRASFRVDRVSSLYASEAVGCEDGAPPFLNAVLTGYWPGTAESLLALCRRLEAEHGRPNDHARHRSRTLDVDLILFGHEHRDDPLLTLPHPRAHERDFVRLPLREIAPELERELEPEEDSGTGREKDQ